MAAYTYPAIFTREDGGKYSIDFPDIDGCYTCGDDWNDGLAMAGDALALMLTWLDDHGREIPAPSPIDALHMADGAVTVAVSCDTAAYHERMKERCGKWRGELPA